MRESGTSGQMAGLVLLSIRIECYGRIIMESSMDSKRHPLMRLISHLRRHRGTIILASICSVMNKFWDLAPPVLIGMAVDVVALREESFLGNMGWTDPRDQFLILVALPFT